MSSVEKVRASLMVGVNYTTVSRQLSNDLPKVLHTCKKLRLTPPMKAKRLVFPKKHQHWTRAKWVNVMFSDKFIFPQLVVRKRHI